MPILADEFAKNIQGELYQNVTLLSAPIHECRLQALPKDLLRPFNPNSLFISAHFLTRFYFSSKYDIRLFYKKTVSFGDIHCAESGNY